MKQTADDNWQVAWSIHSFAIQFALVNLANLNLTGPRMSKFMLWYMLFCKLAILNTHLSEIYTGTTEARNFLHKVQFAVNLVTNLPTWVIIAP